jgi:hypothetical protein
MRELLWLRLLLAVLVAILVVTLVVAACSEVDNLPQQS